MTEDVEEEEVAVAGGWLLLRLLLLLLLLDVHEHGDDAAEEEGPELVLEQLGGVDGGADEGADGELHHHRFLHLAGCSWLSVSHTLTLHYNWGLTTKNCTWVIFPTNTNTFLKITLVKNSVGFLFFSLCLSFVLPLFELLSALLALTSCFF